MTFMLFAMPVDSSIEIDGEDIQTAILDCEYEPVGVVPGGDKQYVAVQRCPLSHPMAADPNNAPLLRTTARTSSSLPTDRPSASSSTAGTATWSYGYAGGTNLTVINPQ